MESYLRGVQKKISILKTVVQKEQTKSNQTYLTGNYLYAFESQLAIEKISEMKY